MLSSKVVTPVKTGVQCFCNHLKSLDSGFHRNDDSWAFLTFNEFVKIDAFKGRGGGDYMASHDMEDIITILDGRPEIVSEIRSASDDLKDFLSRTFRILLINDEFLDSIPGHLSPDRASQTRLPLLIKRLQEIAEMSD